MLTLESKVDPIDIQFYTDYTAFVIKPTTHSMEILKAYFAVQVEEFLVQLAVQLELEAELGVWWVV